MQILSVYESLGLSIINADGTLTRLGGTVMLPEPREAMSDAANELVPMEELQAVARR
jgi:D-glucosaminate-6-phosphate ammonia-lyase